ncbi:hypothetical protein HaLaN_08613 [Haematococcus lacustris]|uniref:Uncharacterized protein n=1 Tax=Haematococcus lacustris TaxID=44745 RepID=A0A699Z1I9_HAELA|nr:hypothetical protein HaLaN_08613 [Haematococcus lacustris]
MSNLFFDELGEGSRPLLVTPAIGPAIHFLTPSLIRCMRGGLVAGGISVPSSLCCRWTGQLANTSQASSGCLAVLRINTKPTPAQGSPKQQCTKTISP